MVSFFFLSSQTYVDHQMSFCNSEMNLGEFYLSFLILWDLSPCWIPIKYLKATD